MSARAPLCILLLAGACGGAPPGVDLPSGARVRFATAPSGAWTEGVVASVGNDAASCPMLAVPDSWDDPQGYRLVRIDSVHRLALSDRYDGATGEDGVRRSVRMPLDTVGERWTELPAEAVRRRYAGCEPGMGR